MTVDDQALRLQTATRVIFDACFPKGDYETEEREEFPRYQAALAAAREVLGIQISDVPERAYMTSADVVSSIRYALGRAPASLFITARGKNRLMREEALARLSQIVADRFANIEMSHALAPGWRLSPFAHLDGGAPKYGR